MLPELLLFVFAVDLTKQKKSFEDGRRPEGRKTRELWVNYRSGQAYVWPTMQGYLLSDLGNARLIYQFLGPSICKCHARIYSQIPWFPGVSPSGV